MPALLRLCLSCLLLLPTLVAAAPPTVLNSSFFGGSGFNDYIVDVELNAQNEVYIAGTTTSSNLPVTAGSPPFGNPGPNEFAGDGFVCKFAADARTRLWCTYVGGPNNEMITGLAIDAAGNAYASGFVLSPGGQFTNAQAFVAKVSFDGTQVSVGSLAFGAGTLQSIGYEFDDRAVDIAINPAGTELVVVGNTSALNYYNLNAGQATNRGLYDGFIRRYNLQLELLSSTFVGTADEDTLQAVAYSANGRIFYAGSIEDPFTNQREAWAGRLNPTATASTWANVPFAGATYGGAQQDEALDIRPTADGSALAVVGWTLSADFHDPELPGFDHAHAASDTDAFLLLLNANSGVPTYFSYFGNDFVPQLARAVMPMPNGDIVLYGEATHPETLKTDLFLLRMNMQTLNASTVDYSTTWGGDFDDRGYGIAAGAGGLFHVVGLAAANTFQPITANAYQPTMVAAADGFMMRMFETQDFGGLVSVAAATANVAESAGSIVLTVTRTGTEAGASVQYATANGSASAGSDYTATSGTLTFPLDVTSATISIPITNDAAVETNETFTLTLSNPGGDAYLRDPVTTTVTIVDDDTPPLPVLSVSNGGCTVTEGNSGTRNCSFVYTLSATASANVGFRTQTATITASGGSDFTAHSWTVRSIPAGQTSLTVNVPVLGDTRDEDDERFALDADQVSNATLPQSRAFGDIEDDDDPPTLTVDNGGCSVTEGNSGMRNCSFVVRLSAISGKHVTFNSATGGGNATAGSDYTAHSSTPRGIAAGAQTLTIDVPVLGDLADESNNETFGLALTSISNASPGSVNATGTIIDDDNPLPEVVFSNGFQ